MDGATVIVVPLWLALTTIIGGWELGKYVGTKADKLACPAGNQLDEVTDANINNAWAGQDASTNKCVEFMSRLSS